MTTDESLPGRSARADTRETRDPSFERLLNFLKETRSFDFTGYKRASLMRRVRHQMQQVNVLGFDEYYDYLQVHPDEFTALFNTILINVTSFFRDEEAWTYLREVVLPELLAAQPDQPIRAWSAGCASGQEAYTLAMVLAEALGTSAFRDRVKIYATDVDEDALAVARQATYSDKELRGLPAGFLERYFEPVNGRYAFRKELRRNVIFGRNDLVQDAPISRIDLLTCRNALMYFNTETQSKIVSRLGFALKPDGVLFLGKAEMLLNHTAVFEPHDLKRRFFRKVSRNRAEEAVNPLVIPSTSHPPAPDEDIHALRTEAFLTSAVAQIVVDEHDRLALVNHRAATLLALSERDLGRPFQDLEVSYRPVELRVPLGRVTEERAPLWVREVEWRRAGPDPVYLDVLLVPLLDGTGRVNGASISFFDVTRTRQLRVEVEATNRQLELAYEELQSTNEELETTNEELQSTVEELETTNEELQSTNEELETMNEELQSTNDELQVTNDELRVRTLQIGELNQFMQGILGSLEAAVIVVDRQLVVQVWTPRAHDLWGLRAEETVGQYLLNLDSGMPMTELHPWLRAVVSGQQEAVVGEHVTAVNRRGRSTDLRVSVSPLGTEGSAVTGALLLMEDVSGSPEYDAGRAQTGG
jgi:two-component system CheB/CheR fusion protein